MAEVYINGDADINDEETNYTLPTTIEDVKQKAGSLNNELTVDDDELHDINDNHSNLNSGIDNNSIAVAENVMASLDSTSSSQTFNTDELNEKKEIVVLSSESNSPVHSDILINKTDINISDNVPINSDPVISLNNKLHNLIHDSKSNTVNVSSEIDITTIPSEIEKLGVEITADDDISPANVSLVSSVADEKEDLELPNEKEAVEGCHVDNVSDIHVNEVDNIPLTEPYVKISFDDVAQEVSDSVSVSSKIDMINEEDVISEKPIVSGDGSILNETPADLNEDLTTDVSSADLSFDPHSSPVTFEPVSVIDPNISSYVEDIISSTAISMNTTDNEVNSLPVKYEETANVNSNVTLESTIAVKCDLEGHSFDLQLTTENESTKELIDNMDVSEVITNVIDNVEKNDTTGEDSTSLITAELIDTVVISELMSKVEDNVENDHTAGEDPTSVITPELIETVVISELMSKVDDNVKIESTAGEASISAPGIDIKIDNTSVLITTDDTPPSAESVINVENDHTTGEDSTAVLTPELIDTVTIPELTSKVVDNAKNDHITEEASIAINDSDIKIDNSSVLVTIDDTPPSKESIIDVDSSESVGKVIDNVDEEGSVHKNTTSADDIKDKIVEDSSTIAISSDKTLPKQISETAAIVDSESSSETHSTANPETVTSITEKPTIIDSELSSETHSTVNSETVTSVTEKPEVVEDDKPPEDEWLDILGNGLLNKKVILQGNGEKSRPVNGNLVSIKCEGRLDNGTVVDKHNNLKFILGDEDVIQAFDLAVALMEDKEVATVYTDPRYAYGIHGRTDYHPPIPQNAPITYDIAILSIEEGPLSGQMTSIERVKHGDNKRIRGNDLYAREDYSASINAYKRGIKYLEGTDDKDVMNMKIKCLNNLSAAQLKVKAYTMAVQSLDTVLQFEPENVKALFRKGKCLDGLKKEEEALECIKKASMLDPQNKTILQELGRLRSRVAVTHQKEKEMYQRMFQPKKVEVISKEEKDLNWSVKITAAIVGMLGVVAGLLWYKNR